MCRWWDSNPHGFRHQILSLARLPFRHIRIKKSPRPNHGGDTFNILRANREATHLRHMALTISSNMSMNILFIEPRQPFRASRSRGTTHTNLTRFGLYENDYPVCLNSILIMFEIGVKFAEAFSARFMFNL